MPGNTPHLRLPKTPVEVELAFSDGSTRRAELYIADQQARADVRQHVIDLLEGGAGFLPVRELSGTESAPQGADPESDAAAGARFVLVNKATLSWAAIPLTDGALPVEEAEPPEDELYDVRCDVCVHIVGQPSVEGCVLYSPPEDHSRVADYLNQPGRFVRLWTNERLYLVNKDQVQRVIELSVTATQQ